jgi:hypothetical protein
MFREVSQLGRDIRHVSNSWELGGLVHGLPGIKPAG